VPPLIEIVGVTRSYAGAAPLRLRHVAVGTGDRRVIAGLDRGAAEMFVLLVTGAALPEEGVVRVDGRDTREIVTDSAWLASLDRFGLVTERAVLIEQLPVASNLALPLTLSIDPLAGDVRARVERLADEVGLPRARLSAAASSLSADERLRVHLARALAPDPALLLLEHPTASLDSGPARAAFGGTLRDVADQRSLAWVALSNDGVFAARSGGTRQRLEASTGELRSEPLWRRLAGR
jgi:ABC-type lipoprotein export system ATPase subunit